MEAQAFALTDHQIAHVYVQGDDPQLLGKVKLSGIDGWGGYGTPEKKGKSRFDHRGG